MTSNNRPGEARTHDTTIVRRATSADFNAIIELRRTGTVRAFSGASDQPDAVAKLVEKAASATKLRAEMADPTHHVLVAEVDDEIVGTAQIHVTPPTGELSACMARADRRGIGSALMDARLQIARESGLREVWLETDTINEPGVHHAERHGFHEIQSRPGLSLRNNRLIRYSLSFDDR